MNGGGSADAHGLRRSVHFHGHRIRSEREVIGVRKTSLQLVCISKDAACTPTLSAFNRDSSATLPVARAGRASGHSGHSMSGCEGTDVRHGSYVIDGLSNVLAQAAFLPNPDRLGV